jgi:ketosteroid isomerase-like protein
MIEGNNLNTVKDAYQAYKDRNIKALLECLTDDVQWFEVGPPDLIPTAGTRKGREQVGRILCRARSYRGCSKF